MRRPGSYVADKGKLKPNPKDPAMTERGKNKAAHSVDAKRQAQQPAPAQPAEGGKA